MKTEKFQVLEIHDVGREGEETNKNNSQFSVTIRWNDTDYELIWKREV